MLLKKYSSIFLVHIFKHGLEQIYIENHILQLNCVQCDTEDIIKENNIKNVTIKSMHIGPSKTR